ASPVRRIAWSRLGRLKTLESNSYCEAAYGWNSAWAMARPGQTASSGVTAMPRRGRRFLFKLVLPRRRLRPAAAIEDRGAYREARRRWRCAVPDPASLP